jgi:hypothetical protein
MARLWRPSDVDFFVSSQVFAGMSLRGEGLSVIWDVVWVRAYPGQEEDELRTRGAMPISDAYRYTLKFGCPN